MPDNRKMQKIGLSQLFSGRAHGHEQRRRQRVIAGSILWCLAIGVLVGLALFAHAHPKPEPFELTFSKEVQAVAFPSWVGATFRLLTFLSDPGPDTMTVPVVLVLFLLCRWFWQAVFLALAVGVGN